MATVSVKSLFDCVGDNILFSSVSGHIGQIVQLSKDFHGRSTVIVKFDLGSLLRICA